MPLLSIITFLSAFLMFQIELVIAKLFLPHYGGSYLVWGACVVFFQAVLLLGYVFAHYAIERFGARSYLKIHLGLLLLPFLFFPGHDIHVSSATTSVLLVLDVFGRLTTSIGPVFLILSTVSLVTQSWLSASYLPQKKNPYALYAISNLGSFSALISYPFILERYLTNTEQLYIWKILYIFLVLATILAWFLIKTNSKEHHQEQVVSNEKIPLSQILRWVLLSAGGVMMFLSVTNIITYEVAPLPLLWVIPLGIYLMAFVLNFKRTPWCPSWIKQGIGAVLGLQVILYFVAQSHVLPVLLLSGLFCFLLFCTCMYAQNQLIQAKPESDHRLTWFYVMISLGGFIGGVLTSWVIPLLSNTLVEYLIGLLLIAWGLKSSSRKLSIWISIICVLVLGAIFFYWPQVFKSFYMGGLLVLLASVGIAFSILAFNKKFFVFSLIGVIVLTPIFEPVWQNAKFLLKKRNYYGIYEVYDSPLGVRMMLHGTTLHGVQFYDEQKRHIPVGYYSPISAVGSLLISDIFQSQRIAIVGLGTGGLSAYSKPSCPIDYYELDPDVYDMAKKYFWYLGDAAGQVNVIMGDARVSLQKVPQKYYDLLIIDAFGGDAIPTHLVNKDVVVHYREKITDRGALIFHITNRYLNLEPVLAKIAEDFGARIAIKDVPDGGLNMRSIWCVLTWDDERFARMVNQEQWRPIGSDPNHAIRVWTDDYSTALPIMNFRELLNSIKNFKFWSW